MVWEHHLFDFCSFKMVRVCFVAQMWSALVDVPCDPEKNVYSTIVGWSILKTSIRFSWLMVLFSSTVFLLIFCLSNLVISNRKRIGFKKHMSFVFSHPNKYVALSHCCFYLCFILKQSPNFQKISKYNTKNFFLFSELFESKLFI